MQENNISTKHISSEGAKALLPYVQAAGHFYCDDKYVVKRKKYDSILIIITLSGSGTLKYNNKLYKLKKYMGVIIDCNQPHVYFTDKNEVWEFIWVHFKGSQIFDITNYILNSTGPIFMDSPENILTKSIGKIIDILPSNGMYYDILLSSELNNIMTELLLQSNPAGKKNANIPDIVNKAIAIIETTFFEEISMDQLAKVLFTNKFDLIRKFKKYLGITPYDYLINYRLNHSKYLLENTSQSILQIANNSGFQDVSYFIKTFKSHENLTPLKYRGVMSK